MWVFVSESGPKEGEGGGNLAQLTGAKKLLTVAELDGCLAVTENTLQGVMRLRSLFVFFLQEAEVMLLW